MGNAGDRRIVACAPPRADGGVQPAQLYAMERAGADEVYVAGGAQAIATMAYGTGTAPSVNEITEPGTAFVIEAKRQVYGRVGIDFLVCPTEVSSVANETADPEPVATDPLAWTEHAMRSRPVHCSTDRDVAEATVETLHDPLPRFRFVDVARERWEKQGDVVLVDRLNAAVEAANDHAIEHLQVMIDEPRQLRDDLHRYGSPFPGHHSPVVFGDEAAGADHALPTLEAATDSADVNVTTYLRVLTHQLSAEPRIVSADARELARELEVSPSGEVTP